MSSVVAPLLHKNVYPGVPPATGQIDGAIVGSRVVRYTSHQEMAVGFVGSMVSAPAQPFASETSTINTEAFNPVRSSIVSPLFQAYE